MPFAYAVYWTLHSVMLLSLAHIVARRSGWSILKAVIILSIPVNYAFDITVESIAVAMGWWTYDPAFGPVIQFANGGRQPLTWPILLMTGWPNVIAYWASKPPLHSLNSMERCVDYGIEEPLLGLNGGEFEKKLSMKDRFDADLDYTVTISRWKFELARLGAWFVVFQVSFFVMLIIPLVSMRYFTGRGSKYIP
ncbi:MAG: hypothetical protein M1818_008321 [Claussenomyces sp. TS43310]|nr:MAG: hypothetical protein M1818_008321 [Claussenomyces sp. TS43310]